MTICARDRLGCITNPAHSLALIYVRTIETHGAATHKLAAQARSASSSDDESSIMTPKKVNFI